MQREKINTFLVNAFNTILQLEDRALSSSHEFSNLSVSEFHVIEAVIACGENSSMSAISKRLGSWVPDRSGQDPGQQGLSQAGKAHE